jgi:uncharacterized OB-fold protein
MAETATVSKLIPEPDEDSKQFFDGALEGNLMLMKCNNCGTHRMPSRKNCDICLSTDTSWVASSGKGTVYTFSIMHQQFHPGYQVPYNIITVELEEGPRINSNMVGIENDAIKVGMPVQVEFERYDDVALPKFRPI